MSGRVLEQALVVVAILDRVERGETVCEALVGQLDVDIEPTRFVSCAPMVSGPQQTAPGMWPWRIGRWHRQMKSKHRPAPGSAQSEECR